MASPVISGKRASSRRASDSSRESQPPDPERISILVVDDTPDKLTAIDAVLADLNQNVVKAGSGRDALKLLLKQEFSLILLDVNMPGMDGFETASLIRRRRSCAHVPIIFLTAFSAAESDIYQGYHLGAVDYIFGPLVPEVLRAKVSVFIELARKTAQIKAQAEEVQRLQEAHWRRQLDAASRRLEREAMRNRFFSHSVEMLAIVDSAGRFQHSNPNWKTVLGYAEKQLRQLSLTDLLSPDDRPAILEQLPMIASGKQAAHFENAFRHNSGSWRWLVWTLAYYAEEKAFYLFARDITGRKEQELEMQELNQDLKRRTEELQVANSDLAAFSYSISHDLRTPLRSITGFAQILAMDHFDRLDEEGKQMLQGISRNSLYMSELIDGMLDFCRLGLLPLKQSPLDLRRIAEPVLDLLKPMVAGRQVAFEIEKKLPPACGDPTLVRQLLFNLLANAVKFTQPRETARIVLGSCPDTDPPVFFIRDNGIGFDMKYADKLFGVFQRLHPAGSFEGTGVGLAIVQKIVQRHGGRVWAEAEPNAGATFYFTLAPAEQG